MKKRVIAVFFTVLFCMSLVILPSYSEEISNNDTQQYATGRIPATEEQLSAFKKPENEIGEVKLNAEALAEVQQETSSPLMFSSLQPAEPGNEVLSEAELENHSTVLTATMETLPKACDNSTKEYFPSIKSQEQTNSCVSWAFGYYQMSNNTGRVRGTKQIFSPGWIFELINNGENRGTSEAVVASLLYSYGIPKYYNTNLNYRWASTADIWEGAIANKINRFLYLDMSKADSITKLKKILLNGDVVNFGTFMGNLVYNKCSGTYNSEDIIVGYNDLPIDLSSSHELTIVGYNDNVKIGSTIVGAFKVANSWGTDWGNDGFVWVSYDAFLEICDGDMVYYLEPQSSYTPLLLAEISMNVSARNEIGLKIGIENSENTKSVAIEPDLLDMGESDDGEYLLFEGYRFALNFPDEKTARNFQGDSGAKDATVMIDLTPFILNAPESKNGDGTFNFIVELEDNNSNNYINQLKGFKIIDRVNNREVASTENFPKYANGTTVTANLDCRVEPKILRNNQTLTATFNNNIPLSSVNSSNIYFRKLVKGANRYGENKYEPRLNQVAGNKVKILPPLGEVYSSWTYYRAYFAPTLSTSAGNILGERKKIDFYVTN